MKKIFIYDHPTPIGFLKIRSTDTELIEVSFTLEALNDDDSPIIRETVRQLDLYFTGEKKPFNLPLLSQGTNFQQQARYALAEIPYGETRSYKDLATHIERPTAYRAIGNAINKNPFMIILPCHRIIGADGSLTGYRYGLGIKKQLLDLEQSQE